MLVRGCTGDGCGPLNAGVPVSPAFGNPTVPILGEPFGGSSVNSGSGAPKITFTWNRVAGDTGSNFRYRLYVQDFSRNRAALDVVTPNNFYGAFIAGKVAYHEFEGVTVNEDEKPRMLASIGTKRYVILRNHGLLTWAPTVEEAFLRLWTLERACRVQVATASLGSEHAIGADVLARNAEMEAGAEARLTEDVFAALQRIIDRKDPSYRH